MKDDTQEHVATIDSIEEKTTKNGKTYVQIETRDGTRYSSWKDDWNKELMENRGKYLGDTFCIVYVQNGKYRNLDSVLDADQATTGSSGESSNTGGGSGLSRNERIKRQWALKVAAQIGPGGSDFASADNLPGERQRIQKLFDRAETVLEEAEERWGL